MARRRRVRRPNGSLALCATKHRSYSSTILSHARDCRANRSAYTFQAIPADRSGPSSTNQSEPTMRIISIRNVTALLLLALVGAAAYFNSSVRLGTSLASAFLVIYLGL